MCLFPTLLYRCVVIILHGVAGGQCVDIVLLQALFYSVILKHSDLFKVIAVYFGLLFYVCFNEILFNLRIVKNHVQIYDKCIPFFSIIQRMQGPI